MSNTNNCCVTTACCENSKKHLIEISARTLKFLKRQKYNTGTLKEFLDTWSKSSVMAKMSDTELIMNMINNQTMLGLVSKSFTNCCSNTESCKEEKEGCTKVNYNNATYGEDLAVYITKILESDATKRLKFMQNATKIMSLYGIYTKLNNFGTDRIKTLMSTMKGIVSNTTLSLANINAKNGELEISKAYRKKIISSKFVVHENCTDVTLEIPGNSKYENVYIKIQINNTGTDKSGNNIKLTDLLTRTQGQAMAILSLLKDTNLVEAIYLVKPFYMSNGIEEGYDMLARNLYVYHREAKPGFLVF